MPRSHKPPAGAGMGMALLFLAAPAMAQVPVVAPIALGPNNSICPSYTGLIAKLVACMQD
ncbi:MAG: hypothetical protein JO089_00005, partial [Alphaproteobacteria bacterium]|nr:hypothetical protein [Alphaproteobacteria bacterium]